MGSEYIQAPGEDILTVGLLSDGNIPGPTNTNRIDNMIAGKYYPGDQRCLLSNLC